MSVHQGQNNKGPEQLGSEIDGLLMKFECSAEGTRPQCNQEHWFNAQALSQALEFHAFVTNHRVPVLSPAAPTTKTHERCF